MKLTRSEIALHGEHLKKTETMKERFKESWVTYPCYADELIWDGCLTERGLTKRKIREKNAKAKKPYWRKKRNLQRRFKTHNQTIQKSKVYSKRKPKTAL